MAQFLNLVSIRPVVLVDLWGAGPLAWICGVPLTGKCVPI